MTLDEIRAAVAAWRSLDARERYAERVAIIAADGDPAAEREAWDQLLKYACSWCGEPHAGGPEMCDG